MAREGKHLYGIIRAKNRRSFGPIGVGGRGDEVYVIACKGIGALVSNWPLMTYGSTPTEDLVRHLAVHQAVMEHVMQSTTVIPIKFGTMAIDEEEVLKILEKGYPKLQDVLEAMDSRIELDMVALWADLDSVLKEIGGEEEIKKFKAEMARDSSPPTHEDKLQLGKMVKSALDKKRDRTSREIVDHLKKHALDHRVHDLMDDHMIANVAFLVDKSREKDFDQTVQSLNERYKEKVNFRIIGPLPPYSFSTLEVKTLEFQSVDQARKELELGEEVTLVEIKDAYRRLTRQLHPDTHPDDPYAQKQFERITEAYNTLIDYCQGNKCSFREKEAEGFIRVQVSGAARTFQ
ncbi:MAG: GvpL/GvpF family gas vesicle protein [Thermodesulfobacteriota bacterium]